MQLATTRRVDRVVVLPEPVERWAAVLRAKIDRADVVSAHLLRASARAMQGECVKKERIRALEAELLELEREIANAKRELNEEGRRHEIKSRGRPGQNARRSPCE